MKRRYTEYIEKLADNEVFVFGSNLQGFHGAGAAGFAMRGSSNRMWWLDEKFRSIVYGMDPDKRGRWAVFGVGMGFQEGYEGKSYAIATVEKPGYRGCIGIDDIYKQLVDLCEFAKGHPEWTFLVTKIGTGYGGYSDDEIRDLWKRTDEEVGLPDNIVLPREHEVRS